MLKVNEYFDGKVKSIAFQTETLPATVGVMVPGEYTFSTSQKETMSVVSGAIHARLPGENDWICFNQGDMFIVDADQSFDVRIEVETAYLCLYG